MSDKMLFRFHRGGLKESMETAFAFTDRQDLINKIIDYYSGTPFPIQNNGEDFVCLPYGGIDERIGWDTYLIKMDGHPIGMTNHAV